MASKTQIKTPKLSDSEMAANYGWSLAVLNSNPELKSLFRTAVSKTYTPERFIAELRNTKWYQSQTESQRKYNILRTSEPAAWATQVTQTMATIQDQYSQMVGGELTYTPPPITGENGSGWLFDVADMALRMGWNEAEVRNHVATSVDWSRKVREGSLAGSASGQLQDWRAKAHALGIDPTDDFYADSLSRVNQGADTEDGVLGRLKTLAKQRYPGFADQIDAGYTMDDLTANYKESVGKVLEIPPAQVDVFDKNIQKAIAARDADGKPAPMNIGDFEDTLRQDGRWQFTQNAHDQIGGMGMDLVKSFGLAS